MFFTGRVVKNDRRKREEAHISKNSYLKITSLIGPGTRGDFGVKSRQIIINRKSAEKLD
jgi:hypothetical protein